MDSHCDITEEQIRDTMLHASESGGRAVRNGNDGGSRREEYLPSLGGPYIHRRFYATKKEYKYGGEGHEE